MIKRAPTVLLGLVAGFLLAELLTASFAYFGINVGTEIVRFFDKSYGLSEPSREVADDIYLATRRSPIAIPTEDLTPELNSTPRYTCFRFMGLTGEQGLRNLYVEKYSSVGLGTPNLETANCVYQKIGKRVREGTMADTEALFVKWFDGPTCTFGRCAIDVWLWDGGLLVLSVRAKKIGLAGTRTNGLRDIVVDDFYLFTWDGKRYIPRYF